MAQYAERVGADKEPRLYWGAWYPMNEAGAKHLDKAFRLGVVHDVEFKLV